MYSPLFSPSSIRKLIPISTSEQNFIASSRVRLENILARKSNAIAIAVGPCSIHCEKLTLEYAKALKEFSKSLSSNIQIYMRVFFEKPRTQFAWKGFVHDPFRDNSYDIEAGIKTARNILKEITKIGLPVVAEMLDPQLSLFLQDYISWGMIGSRTSTSQIHRQFASHLPFPVGFKNAQDGNPLSAIHGLMYASHPQKYISTNLEGNLCTLISPGNKHTHLVLRGGEKEPNFDTKSVASAMKQQQLLGINTPILIDCSHDNAPTHKDQIGVFNAFLEQALKSPRSVFGAMIESHLKEGNHLSLTDPCLGIEDTFDLLRKADNSFCVEAL